MFLVKVELRLFEKNKIFSNIIMAPQKRNYRKRAAPRRKLLASSAMLGAAKTAVGYVPTAIKAVRAAKAAYAAVQSFKKKAYPSKVFKTHRGGDMGYIAPHNVKVGKASTNLSISDKVNSIINPVQSFSYINVGKLDATSGSQGVSGFTLTNSFWNEVIAQYPNLRTESTTASNQYLNTGPTNRFLHKSNAIYHTFMNSSTLTAELEIYSYRCLQDIDSGDQFVSPQASWAYAEQINNMLGASGTTDSTLGTSALTKRPTDRSVVGVIGRYWGLMDKCRVYMKPGESFKHNLTTHINRVVSAYMLNVDNLAVIKNHALGFIYVLRGQLVGDSTTINVSTGDTQISFTRIIKTSFSTMNQNRKRDVIVVNGVTTIAPANQVVINTDSGAQVTGYVEDA